MSAKTILNDKIVAVKSCSKPFWQYTRGMVKVHAFWELGFFGYLVLIGWCIT